MTLHALSQSSSVPLDQILKGALGLVAAVVVGLVIVSQVRRRLNADDGPAGAAGGFMLSDLRQLHAAGQMTDEEFERAKARVVEAAKRAAARDATAQAGPAGLGDGGGNAGTGKTPPGGPPAA